MRTAGTVAGMNTTRIVTAAATALLVGLSGGRLTATGVQPRTIVDRFTAWAASPPVPQRTMRRLTAHKVGSPECAWLVASTAYDPERGLSYEILNEDGPGLLRRRLRQVLEHEQRAWTTASRARWALTDANYTIDVVTQSPRGARLHLTPRRGDAWLLDAAAILTGNGEVVRLEGHTTASPSFWLRDVSFVREYALVGDRPEPTRVTSEARVRWFGTYRFTMTYAYGPDLREDAVAADSCPITGVEPVAARDDTPWPPYQR